jgi:hypothetical protein
MRSVEVECEILATSGHLNVMLNASGKNVVLSCRRVGDGIGTLSLIKMMLGSKQSIHALHSLTASQSMSLQLELCGRLVAQLGYRSKPGLFSWFLGFYPAQVYLWQLCAVVIDDWRSHGARGQ